MPTEATWKRYAKRADAALAAIAERDGLKQQVSDMTQEILDSHHKVAAMTAERDGLALALQDAGMMRLALESDVHILQAKLEAVEAVRASWDDRQIVSTNPWDALAECMDDIDAALATTGPSLGKAVDAVLAWLLDEQAECGNVLNADAVICRLKEALKREEDV